MGTVATVAMQVPTVAMAEAIDRVLRNGSVTRGCHNAAQKINNKG
jgi:hypothetical protein